MDGSFALVAYEASDEEAQTSSGPSDNGGGDTPAVAAEDEVAEPEDVEAADALAAEARALQALEELLPADIWNPPEGVCDPALQARVADFLLRQQRSGKHVSNEIRKNRDYRNPYFLEKMVTFYGIDPLGSAFPREAFDPHGLPPEDSAQALLNEFQAWQAKRREERERTQRIEFTKGGSGGGSRISSSHAKQLQEARDKAQALAAKLAAQRR